MERKEEKRKRIKRRKARHIVGHMLDCQTEPECDEFIALIISKYS